MIPRHFAQALHSSPLAGPRALATCQISTSLHPAAALGNPSRTRNAARRIRRRRSGRMDMSQDQAHLDIAYFHPPHVPARFARTPMQAAPPSQRARWEAIGQKLRDEDLLAKDIRDG